MQPFHMNHFHDHYQQQQQQQQSSSPTTSITTFVTLLHNLNTIFHDDNYIIPCEHYNLVNMTTTQLKSIQQNYHHKQLPQQQDHFHPTTIPTSPSTTPLSALLNNDNSTMDSTIETALDTYAFSQCLNHLLTFLFYQGHNPLHFPPQYHNNLESGYTFHETVMEHRHGDYLDQIRQNVLDLIQTQANFFQSSIGSYTNRTITSPQRDESIPHEMVGIMINNGEILNHLFNYALRQIGSFPLDNQSTPTLETKSGEGDSVGMIGDIDGANNSKCQSTIKLMDSLLALFSTTITTITSSLHSITFHYHHRDMASDNLNPAGMYIIPDLLRWGAQILGYYFHLFSRLTNPLTLSHFSLSLEVIGGFEVVIGILGNVFDWVFNHQNGRGDDDEPFKITVIDEGGSSNSNRYGTLVQCDSQGQNEFNTPPNPTIISPSITPHLITQLTLAASALLSLPLSNLSKHIICVYDDNNNQKKQKQQQSPSSSLTKLITTLGHTINIINLVFTARNLVEFTTTPIEFIVSRSNRSEIDNVNNNMNIQPFDLGIESLQSFPGTILTLMTILSSLHTTFIASIPDSNELDGIAVQNIDNHDNNNNNNNTQNNNLWSRNIITTILHLDSTTQAQCLLNLSHFLRLGDRNGLNIDHNHMSLSNNDLSTHTSVPTPSPLFQLDIGSIFPLLCIIFNWDPQPLVEMTFFESIDAYLVILQWCRRLNMAMDGMNNSHYDKIINEEDNDGKDYGIGQSGDDGRDNSNTSNYIIIQRLIIKCLLEPDFSTEISSIGHNTNTTNNSNSNNNNNNNNNHHDFTSFITSIIKLCCTSPLHSQNVDIIDIDTVVNSCHNTDQMNSTTTLQTTNFIPTTSSSPQSTTTMDCTISSVRIRSTKNLGLIDDYSCSDSDQSDDDDGNFEDDVVVGNFNNPSTSSLSEIPDNNHVDDHDDDDIQTQGRQLILQLLEIITQHDLASSPSLLTAILLQDLVEIDVILQSHLEVVCNNNDSNGTMVWGFSQKSYMVVVGRVLLLLLSLHHFLTSFITEITTHVINISLCSRDNSGDNHHDNDNNKKNAKNNDHNPFITMTLDEIRMGCMNLSRILSIYGSGAVLTKLIPLETML